MFAGYSADQKPWPYSAATLRRRFGQLLCALGLQSKVVNGIRPYDLGSLRPGGAPYLLNRTDDATLVQRIGRWMSYRVMTMQLPHSISKTIADASSVQHFALHWLHRYTGCTGYTGYSGYTGYTVTQVTPLHRLHR